MSSDRIRSFIAIDLDNPRILSEVDSVQASIKAVGGDVRLVERENIHATVKFLGSVDTIRLGHVNEALNKVIFPKFELEVKGAGAFPSLGRMNVIWIGLGEGWSNVNRIYEQTEKLLSELGFRRESRGFSPHVTIARVRSARKRDELASLLRRLEDKFFGSLTVESLRLKQSVLSRSGPKYSTLHEVHAQQM